MLSISLPMHGVGHADYYLELAQQDYYTAQGNDPGAWFGRGADQLGLHGELRSQSFEHLLWGRSPDGKRPLVQNAGNPSRQTAWDLTFSAPKSVSVLWALAPEDVRAQIEAAHRQAVGAALGFLEETTGLTRRGKAGARLERADLVFALFSHYSSRALDPQIHTHCLLINLAVRRDGTTGALWSKEFFRAKKAAGAVFQVELASALRERLGLAIELANIGFQLSGVSRELCRLFSQRSEAMRAVLDERKDHDARTAKQVALATRPKKENVPRKELAANWRARAEPLGWNVDRALSLLHRCQAQPCSQSALEQRFKEEVAKLPAEKRTPGLLRGLAAGIAVQLQADARMFRPLLRFVSDHQAEPDQARSAARTTRTNAAEHRDATDPKPAKTGQGNERNTTSPAPQRKPSASQTGAGPSRAEGVTPPREQAQPETRTEEANAAEHRDTTDPKPAKTGQGSERNTTSPDPERKPSASQTGAGPSRAEGVTPPGEQAQPETRTKEANATENQEATGPEPSRPKESEQRNAGNPGGHRKPSASQAKSGTSRARPVTPPPEAGRAEQPDPKPTSDKAEQNQQRNSQEGTARPHSGQSSQSDAGRSRPAGARPEPGKQQTGQNRSNSGRRTRRERQRTRQDWRRRSRRRVRTKVEENAELLRRLDPRRAHTKAERDQIFFTWKNVMENGRGEELFGGNRSDVARRQAKANRRFQRAFDDQAVFIPAAAQTRQRLTFLAVKLAVKHQADPRSLYQTLHEMRPAAERGLVSVEWRRVFPYAPKWSPARYWKAPVVVLGRPRMKASRWGTIRWQWRFGSTEVRVQNRRLFPNAPQWSPARKLSLPALRLLRKTDRVKETVRSEKSWQKKQQKKKAKKQSQSQSQSH